MHLNILWQAPSTRGFLRYVLHTGAPTARELVEIAGKKILFKLVVIDIAIKTELRNSLPGLPQAVLKLERSSKQLTSL